MSWRVAFEATLLGKVRAHLAVLLGHVMDERLLGWSKRLIATASVTDQGTRAIAELCARELLAPAGIEARLLVSKDEGPDQVNLLAIVKGRESGLAPIVLNAHLDTVSPGDPGLWTESEGKPFVPTIKGDRIYGLGAADTKLDFVAKALALVDQPRPRRDIYLLGSFGEEHGLTGAKELSRSGLLPRGALTFVGEPSGLALITAHRALMVFRLDVAFRRTEVEPVAAAWKLVFTGRSAHSSTPQLGRNAIRVALAELVKRPTVRVIDIHGGDAVNKVPARCEVLAAGDDAGLIAGAEPVALAEPHRHSSIPTPAIAALAQFVAKLEDFAAQNAPPEQDFAPPTLTCNPGVVNASADGLSLEFELRAPPSMTFDLIREALRSIAAGITRAIPGVELVLTERRADPGFRSASPSLTLELARMALSRAGLPLASGVKRGCTEAGIYAAIGLDPAVFGPGPSTGVIHAPNEYNLLPEVEGAAAFYRELLEL